MIKQKIDNVTFILNEFRNLSFLSKHGKVFCVFDQNDSGNISFGVVNDKIKYFVKIAGTKTIESSIQPKDAVENLKNAMRLYDGSIIYDFANDITTICDIDFFRPNPTYNDMGKDFFGTKRFKSPEEYIYGAKIDTVTNVYTLGALIFHFFGSYTDEDINKMYKNNSFYPCELESWQLNKELYDIVIKSINIDRVKRYNSIVDFYIEWNKALRTL